MAQKTILVCDRCGAEGAQRVQVVLGSRRLMTDLCAPHLAELTGTARPLPRGRRPGSTVTTSAPRGPRSKASAGRRRGTRARKGMSAGARRAATRSDVAVEVNRLRSQGLSYRQVGDALMEKGIKPERAARWNPIVLARIAKRPTA